MLLFPRQEMKKFSSQSSGPKNNSSQLLWQVGTVAAVVGTYVAVNAAMSYATDDSNEVNDASTGNGPGTYLLLLFPILAFLPYPIVGDCAPIEVVSIFTKYLQSFLF